MEKLNHVEHEADADSLRNLDLLLDLSTILLSNLLSVRVHRLRQGKLFLFHFELAEGVLNHARQVLLSVLVIALK